MFGFSREQMMEMGIQDEDTLTLVYTHECVHRVLQNMNGFEGKVEELACDYFSGIHAVLNGMDTTTFENTLAQTVESDTHPAGSLRAEAIGYGQKIAKGMAFLHEPLTLENCMKRFDNFLDEHPEITQ